MKVLEVSHAARPVGHLLVVVDAVAKGVTPGGKLMSLGGVWLVYHADEKSRQLTIIGGEGIAKGERLALLPNG